MTTASTTSRPSWRHWTALLVLGLPLFMMATDFTAIFLAMPAVGAGLAPTATQMLWMVHIGELVAAGMVITMGWLTGRIGPRTLLLASMTLYGLASALAAFSPSAETFLLARVLIGLATAAATPAAIAMLRSLFTSARHYGIAFAVVMGAFTVGGALGPPLTGLLLEYFWWGSVFLVNVPVAVLALLVGLWLFPGASETTTDRLDMTSVAVSMAAVMLAVFGLQEIADRGFAVSYAVAVGVGVVLGAWFIRRQRRVGNPLLDLGMFSIRALRVVAIFFVLSHVAFMAADFVLVQYLQIVAGVPTGTLGLLLAIPAVAAIITTALTPVVTRRFAPSTVMAAGIGVAVIGTLLVVIVIAVAPVIALVTVGLTLMSGGVSPAMVLGAQLVVTSVPKRQAGSAAAVQDISASLGAAVGIVLLGSLAMGIFGRGLNVGAPDTVAPAELASAGESPGGAVAVAEAIGGATGDEFLPVIHDAWSWATVVVYAVAVVVGVLTMVLTARGLRGVRMPADETPTDPAAVTGREPSPSTARRDQDRDHAGTLLRPPAG